jgi:hypothetical protein
MSRQLRSCVGRARKHVIATQQKDELFARAELRRNRVSSLEELVIGERFTG